MSDDNDDWFNNWVALGLFIWQLVIYLPQYHKIIKDKISLGHHSWFMFMGHTASFLAWINALIYYIHPLHHCSSYNWGCLVNIYGLCFYFLQWFLFLIWYVLYLFFLGVEETEVETPDSDFFSLYRWNMDGIREQQRERDSQDSSERNGYHCYLQEKRRYTYIGFIVSIAIGIAAFVVTIMLVNREKVDDRMISADNFARLVLPAPLLNWSLGLEVFIMLGLSLHYIPQIWEIVRLGQVGSYSLLSLLLMIPGNVLWTIFLSHWSFLAHHHPRDDGMMEGTVWTARSSGADSHEIMQVWIPYLIMTISQGVTLVIGNYYYWSGICEEKY